jgi:hypothetical protein
MQRTKENEAPEPGDAIEVTRSMSRKEGTVMLTKVMALGVTALGIMVATSAYGSGSAEEALRAAVMAGAVEPPEGEFCGGFAGIPCPDGYACVDDPSDDCDPERGGADCGGVCVAEEQATLCRLDPTKEYVSRDPAQCDTIRFMCEEGSHPFFDACGCGCQAGVACGNAVCGAGEFCCNESCSICAPEGGYCTKQFCVFEPD